MPGMKLNARLNLLNIAVRKPKRASRAISPKITAAIATPIRTIGLASSAALSARFAGITLVLNSYLA